MGRYAIPVEDRFADKFDVADNGCWTWTASTTPLGYGQIQAHGKWTYAHRVSWEIAVGPIPEGLTIDHLCKNRACVNPDHLEPVTQKENMWRGALGDKWRAAKEQVRYGRRT